MHTWRFWRRLYWRQRRSWVFEQSHYVGKRNNPLGTIRGTPPQRRKSEGRVLIIIWSWICTLSVTIPSHTMMTAFKIAEWRDPTAGGGSKRGGNHKVCSCNTPFDDCWPKLHSGVVGEKEKLPSRRSKRMQRWSQQREQRNNGVNRKSVRSNETKKCKKQRQLQPQ